MKIIFGPDRLSKAPLKLYYIFVFVSGKSGYRVKRKLAFSDASDDDILQPAATKQKTDQRETFLVATNVAESSNAGTFVSKKLKMNLSKCN